MDMEIDRQALMRRDTTKALLRLLEYALEEVMGHPVTVVGLKTWTTPGIFDERRIYGEPPAHLLRPLPHPVPDVLPSQRGYMERRLARREALRLAEGTQASFGVVEEVAEYRELDD